MISIAPTDIDWFNFLKSNVVHEEINFWTPTPWNVKRLKRGDKFYFMLKSPIRKIGGYGHFKYYDNLTATEAWNRFGNGNGVTSLTELVSRCSKYVQKNSILDCLNDNPIIGCIVLENAIFFDEEKYFSPEQYKISFPPQVVKMKYFEDDFLNQIEYGDIKYTDFNLVNEQKVSYKVSKNKDRKGQSLFRLSVLEAYQFECAITGERCRDILEGAHIQHYINDCSNHIQNGIVLRVDLHRLFDAGLITIDSDYRVLVSPLLKSDYYLSYHEKEIRLPNNKILYPSQKALEYHRTFVFRNIY